MYITNVQIQRTAAVPRALQLRVALDDWERNDVHERVRA